MFDLVSLFLCGLAWVLSPLLIHFLYDERYAGAGEMLAILSLSFFTWRFAVAHQLWLALGLTKYQAMDNIIRAISLWVLLPLLLALGGAKYAIWGVALHALPTLILVVYVNRKVGLFDLRRELIVLPMVLVGMVCGEAVLAIVNWF